MMTNTRAEIIKQLHRPANWLLLAIAVVQSLTFAYVIPYAGYAGTATGSPASDRGLATMLPDRVIGNTVGGLPIFVGALALIFGVLVTGSEYGWQTWKTMLAQRPSRIGVYLGKLVTIAIGALILVLALLATAATASAVVAAVADQPADWPAVTELAIGVGVGWLITMMWATLGVLLAIVFRGVALPIGLGLVWLLAVQNLLAAIAAPLLDWVAQAQKVLPGPNAGSLAAAVGASPQTPGVSQLVGSGHATVVLLAYLVAFAATGAWLLYRRDVT
jgi:ABC-2 type transport system permease protein